MGLQLSSLMVGDTRGTVGDTSGVSGITQLDTGASQTAGEAQTGIQAEPVKARDVKEALPDQCGLHNDGVAWVRKSPPLRKRTTEATAEEQAFYRRILGQIFSGASLLGQRVDFDPNDVIQISVDVLPYLNSEPALIEDIPPPLTIISDLHGQLYDLNRIFAHLEKDGQPGYEAPTRFVFLGNYVDRGRQSLEVVMALFILKILYPDRFFLLRGNHEFTEMNAVNGFAAEIVARFGVESARQVYGMINTTFCWLSLAAIVGGKYFLVHAGISTTSFNRRSLRNLRKPIFETTESYLVHDMVWSDPAGGLTGTCWNADRETSIYYGRDAFAYAMHKIGGLIMIRGHTRLNAGAACTWNRIYTVYSATACGGQENMGAFIKLFADLSLKAYILPVDQIRQKVHKELGFDKKNQLEEEPENATEGRNDSVGSGTIAAFGH